MNVLLKNPLLKKEIHLLLPAWGLTLLLAVVPALLFPQHDDPRAAIDNFTPVWLGVMILCASSFGREFSLGTFSSLLAQPFPRRQYWLVKVGVLVAALVSVLLVYGVCTYPAMMVAMGWTETAWLFVLLLAAVAGGLWMALLIRQVVAVVWLIALVPGLLSVPFLLVLAHFEAANQTEAVALYIILFVYSVAGIAGSWLILRRAQDVPWSGGTITLPEWLTAALMPRSAATERARVPWQALIRKEFHFNQVLLFGMAGLFLLDLGEVGVRFLRRHADGDFNSLLQVLGVLPWVLMPLILGCTSIAEERKMGTMESQLCQPVSLRRQFLVKLGFVVVIGGLVSSLLPCVAEGFAQIFGVGQDEPPFMAVALSTAGMCAIAVIGFFASSLTRNVLQALPIALGMIMGLGFVIAWFVHYSGFNGSFLIADFVLWNPLLPIIILSLALPVALVWLAYGNFRSLHEAARIWWRNGLGLAAVLVCAVVVSLALYHRIWERLLPFEPAHRTARWVMSQPPLALRTDLGGNLLIALPDGRYWFGSLEEDRPPEIQNDILRVLYEMLPFGTGPRLKVGQFIPSSDWTSLTAGYMDLWAETGKRSGSRPPRYQHIVNSRETVGIHSDGTLWVSEKATGPAWNNAPLVQFGTENDWKQVLGERSLSSVLLLKENGTLWRWGEKTGSWSRMPPGWTGLQAQTPHQIGTNSDWENLIQFGGPVAQKRDGTLWNIRFNAKDKRNDFVLNTNYSQAGFADQRWDAEKVAGGYANISAGIRSDGTLWIWGDNLYWSGAQYNKFVVRQSSTDTNWQAVALGSRIMVALKSDGTLWRWGGDYFARQFADEYMSPPKRLGTHHDWVALAQTWEGVVSVAADGSLWFWPESGGYYNVGMELIEPSHKPVALGNVFALK